jgi:rieske iron-sulfur protein
MNTPLHSPSTCSGCQQQADCVDSDRRHLLGLMAAGAMTTLPFVSANALADTALMQLVDADAENDFKPLRPSDLKPGKPLLVFPFDVKAAAPKNESRLNKLVLMKLPEDQMASETKARSASGVVAYSGICTHQGCEVKTWIAKESALVCFCHASKFALLDGGKVITGPATRALPAVALTMDGEFLAIAKIVSPTPGQ